MSNPQCSKGHKMVKRNGSYGLFWGCSKYPNCYETRGCKDENKKIAVNDVYYEIYTSSNKWKEIALKKIQKESDREKFIELEKMRTKFRKQLHDVRQGCWIEAERELDLDYAEEYGLQISEKYITTDKMLAPQREEKLNQDILIIEERQKLLFND